MVKRKVIKKLIDRKSEIPDRFSKIKSLSKFDFARVFEFAIKEVVDSKKSGREPLPENVSKYAPDMSKEIIEEFINFSKEVVKCWEKHKDNIDDIINCLKGE